MENSNRYTTFKNAIICKDGLYVIDKVTGEVVEHNITSNEKLDDMDCYKLKGESYNQGDICRWFFELKVPGTSCMISSFKKYYTVDYYYAQDISRCIIENKSMRKFSEIASGDYVYYGNVNEGFKQHLVESISFGKEGQKGKVVRLNLRRNNCKKDESPGFLISVVQNYTQQIWKDSFVATSKVLAKSVFEKLANAKITEFEELKKKYGKD